MLTEVANVIRSTDQRRPLRDTVQPFVEDVVLAAGWCKPNAADRHHFMSFAGHGRRAVLQAAARYHGEQMAIARTPIETVVFSLGFRSMIVDVARWRNDAVTVVMVEPWTSRHQTPLPAFEISHRTLPSGVEAQAARSDAETLRLIALLESVSSGTTRPTRIDGARRPQC